MVRAGQVKRFGPEFEELLEGSGIYLERSDTPKQWEPFDKTEFVRKAAQIANTLPNQSDSKTPNAELALQSYHWEHSLIGAEWVRSRRQYSPLIVVFALSAATITLNPYGLGIYSYLWTFLNKSQFMGMDEVQPSWTMPAAGYILAFLVIALQVMFRQRRVMPMEALIISAGASLSAVLVRRYGSLAVVLIWPYFGLALSKLDWKRYTVVPKVSKSWLYVPVYIDTRYDMYPKLFCQDAFACMWAAPGALEYIEGKGASHILVRDDFEPINRLLDRSAAWTLIVDDGNISFWGRNNQLN
ncbi:unnamed protein product [Sphagnum jensenii]|uniref:Uncharacterized protein n=1 Tax=Sphagnum jensenii TaxID=128206 RepID=A0ABP0VC64_9BRYO